MLTALLLAVSIFPLVSTPPGYFRVTVIVPRHEDNRRLILVFSDEYGMIKKSEMNLDKRSPLQYVRYLTKLPSGEYTYEAIVIQSHEGKEKMLYTSMGFVVIGG